MASLSETVNSKEKLVDYCQRLTDFFWEHKYINITATDKRNLDQNALQFYWYEQLEKQGDKSRDEYRNYCKYKFGVPILAQNPDHDWIVAALKTINWVGLATSKQMSVEECKIEFVGTMQITSLMSADEMGRYLDGIKTHFEPNGFHLPTRKERNAEIKEIAKRNWP